MTFCPSESDPADEPPPYRAHPHTHPTSSWLLTYISRFSLRLWGLLQATLDPLPTLSKTRFPLPSLPATRSRTQHMFPLTEVAELEGPPRVHVLFSLSDMSQIEEKLRSFSENSSKYKKEFLWLTQAYHLTWSDI